MVLYISSKSSQVAEFEKEFGSAFPHPVVDKLQSNLIFFMGAPKFRSSHNHTSH